jgi:Zn finger protein HypA/HybF involved in hydrogenase expression
MAECHDCEYEWNYAGSLNRATCPNCGAKVRVNDDG